MAATDQTYRSQKALDIVFAVSSVAMLVSIIGMFVQDYNRAWKAEQRVFRDVEAALLLRQTAHDLPDPDKYRKALKEVEDQRDSVNKKKDTIAALNSDIAAITPQKERRELRVGDIKSQLASRLSFYNIAVENKSSDAEIYAKEVKQLEADLQKGQAELDETMARLKAKQRERDEIEKPLIQAETQLKQITDDMLRRARAALKKQWGAGDFVRSLPVLDAFASPTKIHQIVQHDITIDYNFKGVSRFDRCMTCHQGIDRAAFSRDKVAGLLGIPDDLDYKVEKVQKILEELRAAARPGEADSIPDPDRLRLTKLSKDHLTDARINEFCAHPRLHLFVGSNSKHPAEKFGCTSCHSGQGSATDFYWASHAPNDARQQKKWKGEHGWEKVHHWDFPMLPKRFVESSCLKCHHQVTDLITDGVREEAPKLLKGFRLIREYGCFGCHEIPGKKNGVDTGPDLRLEPYPPLDSLTPAEREKLTADPANPPGTLRKVGPSLFRVSEKTNEEFTARWIMSPRSFRPDTRMPHFYGTSNNDPKVLPPDQKDFPNAEVYAITKYLFTESNNYLRDVKQAHEAKDRYDAEERADRLAADVVSLNLALKNFGQDPADKKLDDAGRAKKKLQLEKDAEQKRAELEELRRGIALRKAAPPISQQPVKAPKGKAEEIQLNGRKLFTERGCLACHNHKATTEPTEDLPSFKSEAHFGPTLSQITAKLGAKAGDKNAARTWLVRWITSPHSYSPRTKMPVTHLTDDEAGAVAEWLLSQPATELGADWANVQVTKPKMKTLEELVRVYLVNKVMSKADTEELLKKGRSPAQAQGMPADEKALAIRLFEANGDDAKREQQLTWYIGRKGVGRLGCYACHDVPGFENAKPIGTQLNEWGKKEPDRLAFENIVNYVKEHYEVVDGWTDGRGHLVKPTTNKPLVEKFFAEMLDHHGRTREGYLHQKVKDPRSYDYKRELAWDVRSRMPVFQFAHPKQRGKESEEDASARAAWEKAAGLKRTPARDKEPDAEFRVREQKEEAESREAVMTFVLGLTGEQIPYAYRNNPAGDRLAEVKGRQVLETFNCNGCHQVRPGVYDVKLTAKSVGWLRAHYEEKAGIRQQRLEKVPRIIPYPDDYNFLEHIAWAGRTPTNGLAPAYGLRARAEVIDDPLHKGAGAKQKVPAVRMRLSEALRVKAPDGSVFDLRAGDNPLFPADEFANVPSSALASPEAFADWSRRHGTFGGDFGDLLTGYLMELNPEKFGKAEEGNDAKARASVPPWLMYQGERTQPDWLYRFLLNPHPVRKMTVLRMPRFNLSEDDARALVAYFAGVDRRTNPATGLVFPFQKVPQRGELTDDFWREKNREFVKRLEATKDPDAPKDGKRTVLQRQLDELRPVWEQAQKEQRLQAEEAAGKLKDAEKALKAVKEGDKEGLARATKVKEFWESESKRLAKEADTAAPKAMEQAWRESDAYPASAYRMMKKLCAQCHQTGTQPIVNDTQGPPFLLLPDRLRPEWTQRWLAMPDRMLNYPTVMPQNFKNHPPVPQMPEVFPGTPLEQLTAVRDVLMNYPRIHEMPVNRYWELLEANTAGTGEKK